VTLLDETTVVEHLRRRGLLRDGQDATVNVLGGGVSNVVLRVGADGFDAVVKQALPRLRVAREWLADPGRTVTEGRALEVAARVDPSWVPRVLDVDEARCVLVLSGAPAGISDWKTQLLLGHVDVELAAALGAYLARLHRATDVATAADARRLAAFDRAESFAQLRVRPYFESVLEDHPAAGAVIMPAVREMQRRRRCLVHGDVSPKNVLAGDGVRWLIDFEVAHLGDPAFDVAFMTSHLALKAIHLPSRAVAMREAMRAFVRAYTDAAGLAAADEHLWGLTGALLVARVLGRSPAEYLDEPGRLLALDLGLCLAAQPAPPWSFS
jgi:5-methylthioribose kinase